MRRWTANMGWLAPIGLLFVLMFGMSLASTSSPPSKDEKRQVAFYKTCEDLKAGPDGVVTMAPGVAKFLPPIFCEPAVVSEGELVSWRLPLGGLEIDSLRDSKFHICTISRLSCSFFSRKKRALLVAPINPASCTHMHDTAPAKHDA